MIARLFSHDDPWTPDETRYHPPRRLAARANGCRTAVTKPAQVRADTDGTDYEIARTREQLFGAFELVYRTYLRAQLTPPNRHRKRVSMFHCLETSDVFVATQRGRVICTMTLIGDSELGIPMETLYPEQVLLKRARGLRIAEVGSLAQRELGTSFSVLLRLIQLMTQRATQREIDELLIVVHPRHVKFYQGFLAFEPIGPCCSYSAVCNQPAVGMSLNLRNLKDRNRRASRRMYGKPYPAERVNVGPLSYELRDEVYDLAVQIIDNGNSIAHDPRRELVQAA